MLWWSSKHKGHPITKFLVTIIRSYFNSEKSRGGSLFMDCKTEKTWSELAYWLRSRIYVDYNTSLSQVLNFQRTVHDLPSKCGGFGASTTGTAYLPMSPPRRRQNSTRCKVQTQLEVRSHFCTSARPQCTSTYDLLLNPLELLLSSPFCSFVSRKMYTVQRRSKCG